jgi:hypothetical protein
VEIRPIAEYLEQQPSESLSQADRFKEGDLNAAAQLDGRCAEPQGGSAPDRNTRNTSSAGASGCSEGCSECDGGSGHGASWEAFRVRREALVKAAHCIDIVTAEACLQLGDWTCWPSSRTGATESMYVRLSYFTILTLRLSSSSRRSFRCTNNHTPSIYVK